jgi:hypothetical protein
MTAAGRGATAASSSSPPWWRLFWYIDRLSPRLADKLAEGALLRMRRELERLQGS